MLMTGLDEGTVQPCLTAARLGEEMEKLVRGVEMEIFYLTEGRGKLFLGEGRGLRGPYGVIVWFGIRLNNLHRLLLCFRLHLLL